MDAKEALQVAARSKSTCEYDVRSSSHHNLLTDMLVTVTPLDYGAVPVQGNLMCCNDHSISIRRIEAEIGELVVHFPRIGYRVEACA